jgi:hypothetical protein
VGITGLGVLERKATEQVHERFFVAAEAVGLAGEAVESHEGVLVILRGDRFFDL